MDHQVGIGTQLPREPIWPILFECRGRTQMSGQVPRRLRKIALRYMGHGVRIDDSSNAAMRCRIQTRQHQDFCATGREAIQMGFVRAVEDHIASLDAHSPAVARLHVGAAQDDCSKGLTVTMTWQVFAAVVTLAAEWSR
jgi:hypothetical protein